LPSTTKQSDWLTRFWCFVTLEVFGIHVLLASLSLKKSQLLESSDTESTSILADKLIKVFNHVFHTWHVVFILPDKYWYTLVNWKSSKGVWENILDKFYQNVIGV